MKPKINTLLILFVCSIFSCSLFSNQGWERKSIGKTYSGAYKKTSVTAAALLLKRLGDNRTIEEIREKILSNCVYFRFLGRKLYKSFKITKKLKKNESFKKKFSIRFIKYVLNSLLSCEIITKSEIVYKIKSAKSNSSIGKHNNIIKEVFRLAKIFKGPVISLKKERSKPGYAKFSKKKFEQFPKKLKRKSNKKLKHAIKILKSLNSLKSAIRKAQQKCIGKNFKTKSSDCRKSNRLTDKYILKASPVELLLKKSCQREKKNCFKYKICKKMFRICRKYNNINRNLKNQKAFYFARVFSSIIKNLNK